MKVLNNNHALNLMKLVNDNKLEETIEYWNTNIEQIFGVTLKELDELFQTNLDIKKNTTVHPSKRFILNKSNSDYTDIIKCIRDAHRYHLSLPELSHLGELQEHVLHCLMGNPKYKVKCVIQRQYTVYDPKINRYTQYRFTI